MRATGNGPPLNLGLTYGRPTSVACGRGVGTGIATPASFAPGHPPLAPAQVRNQAGTDLPVTVKIRLKGTVRETVDFARQVEAAGAAWITVHGRTLTQRSSAAVDRAGVQAVRESVAVPVVHNGDVFTRADAEDAARASGAHGAMAARGLLFNPALFAGHDVVPVACIAEYVGLCMRYGTQFRTFHHHISCMLKDLVPKSARVEFQSLQSVGAVLQFLRCMGLCPPPAQRGASGA